jgi:hypothetical protein
MGKIKLPEGVSGWEVGGISAFPIVQAMLDMQIPAVLGMSVEQFFSVLAGLLTLAAILRAIMANRAAKAVIDTTATEAGKPKA